MQMNFHQAEQMNMTKGCWLGYYEHYEHLTTDKNRKEKNITQSQVLFLIY